MKPHELRHLLATISASTSPYDAVVRAGDRFVSSYMTSAERFWSGTRAGREFYTLLALLHHAGANGLASIIDYNEETWLGILGEGPDLLIQLNEPELARAMEKFNRTVARYMESSPGVSLPTDAESQWQLQKTVLAEGLEWLEGAECELEKSSLAFVGCADARLPGKILAWLETKVEELAPLLD